MLAEELEFLGIQTQKTPIESIDNVCDMLHSLANMNAVTTFV